MLPNGRVLYLRWEYTDSAHYYSRVLMSMNPDGTSQSEFYGSNSYWPNSFFYARPIPGHPSKIVAVIGGHHDNPRMGELVVFDPARIQDHATFDKPHQYATGVSDVLVNGRAVLRGGDHTGATPGRFVKGPGWRGR